MPDHDWTPAIGLRHAAISLTWRTALAAALWCTAIWAFDAGLTALGLVRIPGFVALGFAVIAGTAVGAVISRGLDERAGFVSPVLTLMAAIAAGIAIIGGEAALSSVAPRWTGSVRYMIVGTTMVVALAWIVRNTLVDS